MPPTILIVDDDMDTLKLIGTTLERQGYTIHASANGQKALELAVLKSPDLIILDVMMPDMDGYEVTKRLREDPKTADIPIILFTAKAQVNDKVEGLDSGAADYLTKPTHPAELVARVKAILKRPKSDRQSQQAEEAKAAAAVQSSVIGILGPKGGLGISTLAINLGVILRQITEENVIVAEMRPGRGDMSIYLGFDPSPKMSQLLKRSISNLNRTLVEDALVEHKSGVRFLLGSYQPSEVDLLSASGQLEAVAQLAAEIAPHLIMDMGVGLPEANKRLLTLCDHVIVAIESHRHTIEQTKALLSELETLQIPQANIHPVVLNRVRMEQALSISQVESALGYKLSAVFTPAPELAHQAANKQTPMVLSDPESFTTSQVTKLARVLLGEEEA